MFHRTVLLLAVIGTYCCTDRVGVAVAQTNAQQAFADPKVQSLIRTNDVYPATAVGKAKLTVTAGNTNVQISNFGANAFMLTNTGTKRIAAAFIDVTGSVFADCVFDNNGTGGDDVAKELNFDSGGPATGVVPIANYKYLWLPTRKSTFVATAPFNSTKLSDENNLFVDPLSNNGKASPKAGGGFRGELVLFTGFDPGESVGFSGDMDSNSIAGFTKGSVDSGSGWDVGGVSGAEIINSKITVLFGDGAMATGYLAADGSQGGSIALVSEAGFAAQPPVVTVNGGSSTYNTATSPPVTVSAAPGATVRVSMVKALNPVVNTQTVASGVISIAAVVANRLKVTVPFFPVNNAKQWQHSTVTIPASGTIDVTSLFTMTTDNLPLAYSAVVIASNGDPLSQTSVPSYVVFSAQPTAPTTKVPVAAVTKAPTIAPVTKAPVSPTTKAPVSPTTSAPVPPAPATGVTSFALVPFNNQSNKIPITNGAVINVSSLGTTGGLNLQAITSPATVGSVLFGYNGNANYRIENAAPYALCGDNSGVYNACAAPALSLGLNTVTATAYSAGGATGTVVGTPVTISFTLQ